MAHGPDGETHGTTRRVQVGRDTFVERITESPLDDQWELYDLTTDPTETDNRWTDPDLHELRQNVRMQLKQARASCVPERNQPWPYASRLRCDFGALTVAARTLARRNRIQDRAPRRDASLFEALMPVVGHP